MKKKLVNNKKGNKKLRKASLKMKMLKWKLKHRHGAKIVKVVKKGGKHARKLAKKEKSKARKLSKLLLRSKRAMAAMMTRMAAVRKRMLKYKKSSKEANKAVVKMKMLKWKLKHAKRR